MIQVSSSCSIWHDWDWNVVFRKYCEFYNYFWRISFVQKWKILRIIFLQLNKKLINQFYIISLLFRLLNFYYQIVTFVSLPNCHYQIVITKLSPYQIFITKLTLPKIRPSHNCFQKYAAREGRKKGFQK